MPDNVNQVNASSRLPLKPMWKFTATNDDGRRAEIIAAIDDLNSYMTIISPSKKLSEQFLELLATAQDSANAQKWDHAHDTIWEATFLLNRAVDTSNSTRLALWLALSPLLSFALIFLFEIVSASLSHWIPSVNLLVSYYSPFLWTGAVGGTTTVFWGLIKHRIELDFDRIYVMWYILKPILGAITGVVSVLIVKAGLWSMQGPEALVKNDLPLFVIAFLAGFSERFFIQLIDRVITALFGGDQPPASSEPKPILSKLKPSPPKEKSPKEKQPD